MVHGRDSCPTGWLAGLREELPPSSSLCFGMGSGTLPSAPGNKGRKAFPGEGLRGGAVSEAGPGGCSSGLASPAAPETVRPSSSSSENGSHATTHCGGGRPAKGHSPGSAGSRLGPEDVSYMESDLKGEGPEGPRGSPGQGW